MSPELKRRLLDMAAEPYRLTGSFNYRWARGKLRYDPMFASLRQAASPEELEGPLRQFLDSRPVNDRTDDDKTLMLATHRPAPDGHS